MMFPKKTNLSYQEILEKLMKYCSYQERSAFEVRQKLREYVLAEEKKEELITYLVEERFLNEERFAEVYVRSKVNVKKWGRYKIKEGLGLKGIKGALSTKALASINEEKYLQNLDELLVKKIKSIAATKEDTPKLYRYLLGKGYESDLIVKGLKQYQLM